MGRRLIGRTTSRRAAPHSSAFQGDPRIRCGALFWIERRAQQLRADLVALGARVELFGDEKLGARLAVAAERDVPACGEFVGVERGGGFALDVHAIFPGGEAVHFQNAARKIERRCEGAGEFSVLSGRMS